MAPFTFEAAGRTEICPIKKQELPERGYILDLKLGEEYQAISYTFNDKDLGSAHYASRLAYNVCNLKWERNHLGLHRQIFAKLINGLPLPDYLRTVVSVHPLLSMERAIDEFHRLGDAGVVSHPLISHIDLLGSILIITGSGSRDCGQVSRVQTRSREQRTCCYATSHLCP